jgi:hypothetical protein
MRLSTTTPDSPPGEISTPVAIPTYTSIPDPSPPSNPPELSIKKPQAFPFPISSPFPEPASPAATEIACDLSHPEPSPEERIETLRAAGIKVRDFAYEPTPISIKAPEVFDPVPCLIAADWHMRNRKTNRGLLSPKALFRLLKMGWLTLAHVEHYFAPFAYLALARYNDEPDERRYPFVVSHKESKPTPSQRVRLRRQANLPTHPYDYPDREFLDMTLRDTRMMRGERRREGLLLPVTLLRLPLLYLRKRQASASTSAVVEAEAEAEAAETVVVEEPKPKRRKVRVKSTTKTRSRAKSKPLRRGCSRPEV